MAGEKCPFCGGEVEIMKENGRTVYRCLEKDCRAVMWFDGDQVVGLHRGELVREAPDPERRFVRRWEK